MITPGKDTQVQQKEQDEDKRPAINPVLAILIIFVLYCLVSNEDYKDAVAESQAAQPAHIIVAGEVQP